MKIPNVLHLRSSSGFFGAEQVILNLVKALPRHGIASRLALLDDGGSALNHVIERFLSAGITPIPIPCRHGLDFKAVRRLKNTARRLDADIIHSHDVKSDFYTLFSSVSRMKRVATQHGRTGDTVRMRLYERVDKRILKYFDRIVVVSEEQMPKRAAYDHWKYIPNGVDINTFVPFVKQCSPDDTSRNNDVISIGMIARLSREKNHALALSAMAMLSDMPNLRLMIVGDGPLREELQNLCRTMGLDSVVTFTGYTHAVKAALNKIDILISTSITEGMPMTILEAMASGVPVAATAVGSIPELLASGRGLVIHPPTPEEVAAAIRSLVKNTRLREQIAHRARDYIKSQLSLDHQARRYADLYRELLQQ